MICYISLELEIVASLQFRFAQWIPPKKWWELQLKALYATDSSCASSVQKLAARITAVFNSKCVPQPSLPYTTHSAHEHTRWLLHHNWEMIYHILPWNWWVPSSITMLTRISSLFLIYSSIGPLASSPCCRPRLPLYALITAKSKTKTCNTHTLSRVGGRRGSV